MKQLVVLALAIALGGCATMPEAEREGARLMALMKTASGGAALDGPAGFHETGTAVRDGMPATYETWGDLRSLKSASKQSMGGMTMSSGFDGKVSWSVGPDGARRLDETAEGLMGARLGTYLTIGGYFYSDRFPASFAYSGTQMANGQSYDVVTVTPAGAAPVDLWLDRESHLLKRVSGMDGATPFSGDVTRYEEVDGAMIGYELRQKQGEHTLALTLTTYTFETVPLERFAPPAQ